MQQFIFFAGSEIPLGPRPFYPEDPVNPACPVKSFLPLFHWGLKFILTDQYLNIFRAHTLDPQIINRQTCCEVIHLRHGGSNLDDGIHFGRG